MTAIGLIGVLLGLLGAKFAFAHPTRLRVYVFGLMYVAHLSATLAYYLFSENNVTDATGYYEDYLDFYNQVGFGTSTLFVFWFVQSLKSAFGGTLLDYFLLFQVPSFYGMCLLMRIFEEVFDEVGITQSMYSYALLFIPGLHFWTSAIGKDGALFLGIALSIWAVRNLEKRLLAMAVALAIMILFRPHIAAIAAVALAFALVIGRRGRASKVWATLGSVIAIAFAWLALQSNWAFDATDADAMAEFLVVHADVVQSAEVAGNTAVYGSYPFKVMSLLFRPLFIDAEDPLAYAASLENALYLMLFLWLAFRARTVVSIFENVLFVRYALIMAIMLISLLAVFYYNIGLGLRQKTMFVVPLLVVVCSLSALTRARRLNLSSGQPACKDARIASGYRSAV